MASTDDDIQRECHHAYQSLIDMFAQKLIAFRLSPVNANNFASLMISSVEGALIVSRAQRDTAPLDNLKGNLVYQMKRKPKKAVDSST